MSKLYANAYVKERNLNVEDIRGDIASIPPKVKYLKTTDEFRIFCLNMFFYFKSNQSRKESETFVVAGKDLFKLLTMDVRWMDEERKELLLYPSEISTVELNDTDLGFNQYLSICFLQKFFTFNKNTMKKIRTQCHLKELKRTESPWFELSQIPANRHGGRPAGSKTQLPDEEHEILLYNLSRYDLLAKKYVEHGSEDKFVYMHQQLKKLPKEELPELLQMPFMNSERRIRWYYYSLRFKYKLSIGVPEHVIDPGRNELCEKSKLYGFPFEYEGEDLKALIDNYDELSEKFVESGDYEGFLEFHKKIGKCSSLPNHLKFAKKGDDVIQALYNIMIHKRDSIPFYNDIEDSYTVQILRRYCKAKNPVFLKYK